MKRLYIVGLVLLTGCTVEDGRGFGHLAGALHCTFAGLAPAAGRVVDGWFKTDNSFEVQLTRLQLQIKQIQLQSSTTASPVTSCSFDPANPPAGCTLCHGGHCHCGGELKSYAELEAQVCGGTGATVSTVATLPVSASQDLLGPGTRQDLTSCSPSCELPATEISGLQLVLVRLQIQGTVRDRSIQDRLAGEQVPVVVDLDLGGGTLQEMLAEVEVVDRDHPYHVELALDLPLTERLLDGIEWQTLTRSQARIAIDAKTNTAAGEVVAASLARTTLVTTITRTED